MAVRPAVIGTARTYDPHDCTTAGHDVAIRADGTARIVSSSRWQGTRDGQVWIAPVPPKVMAAATSAAADEDTPDLQVAVEDWLTGGDWTIGARRIRTGWIVR